MSFKSKPFGRCVYWQDIRSLEFRILRHHLICFFPIVNLNKLHIVHQNKSWLHTHLLKFREYSKQVWNSLPSSNPKEIESLHRVQNLS